LQVEDVLADLIRIKTVNPPGGETEAAKYLKRLFNQHGIPNEIIEPSPGRGSFIAYLGEGERRLLYLSHIDVVTAREGWSFPPFSGEIKDGFVLGRGAIDCKGLAAAEACAMIKLSQEADIKGRLIFAATADEETLGSLGVNYILKNHVDKIRADFAINEGGEAPVKIGGRFCHFIVVGEKGPVWTKLRVKGSAAHGALPMLGENAIIKMAEVIKRISDYRPRVVLIPEVRKLCQALAALANFGDEITEGNVDRFIKKLNNQSFAAYLSAITRMTLSPNFIHGGVKTNIVPDTCEADIDIRVLPGQEKDYVLGELHKIIGSAEMEIAQYSMPTMSTADSGFYRLIGDGLQEFVGDDLVLPSICAGGTDSRLLRETGIPSFGISMMTLNLDPALRRSVHGKDEKIDIESLRLKTDFLVTLARRYLG
jgi:acetylornithine deacetylase/succinyl-diaminopimelate desuccinylase-like protein